jgi:hypothetical protein
MSILLYEGVTLVAAKSCTFVLQHLRTSPKIRLQKSRTKTLRLIEWFEVQQLPGDAATPWTFQHLSASKTYPPFLARCAVL